MDSADDSSSLPADSAPLATRRGRRKEARPGELTAAALELFTEKGFAGTRLEDVAARAGVSKGTLYLYFESKESLFKAVIEEGIFPSLATAEQHIADFEGSATELLSGLLLGWWEHIGSTRWSGVIKLMISESRNFPELAQYYHDNVIVRVRSMLRTALERGIARGEFRNVEVESCIDVVIAPLLMLIVWQNSLCMCGNMINPEHFLATHLDLLANGLMMTRSAS